jgi:ABC-type antimicrobial peptide transport system permease subunit
MSGMVVNIGDIPQTVEAPDVGPLFFEAMSIPLVRGRTFSPEDDSRSSEVVVVNEMFAKTFFPGEDAVGRRIGRQGRLEIVGLVKDTKFSGLRDTIKPTVYGLAFRQDPVRLTALLIRSGIEPASLSRSVQQEVRNLNPRLLVSVRTVQDLIDRSISQERIAATTSAFFNVLGVLLTAMGLFGLASFAVSLRTREWGIRLALGASRSNIVLNSLEETARVFALGLIVGTAAAIAGGRLLEHMIPDLLFGLTANDWTNMVVSVLLVFFIAIAASAVPALRATRADPLRAIRYE